MRQIVLAGTGLAEGERTRMLVAQLRPDGRFSYRPVWRVITSPALEVAITWLLAAASTGEVPLVPAALQQRMSMSTRLAGN